MGITQMVVPSSLQNENLFELMKGNPKKTVLHIYADK